MLNFHEIKVKFKIVYKGKNYDLDGVYIFYKYIFFLWYYQKILKKKKEFLES